MNQSEIIDKDGLVVNGPFSFYAIPGFPGVFFFSEDIEEKPDCYVFDMSLTCLMIQRQLQGQTGFQCIQAEQRGEIASANKIFAPKHGTTRFNSTNALLYHNCRKNASAIKMKILKP